ncbi:hypothetical protein [Dyadobacter bucti]|nr:hypothetical protein [Dyadobacter bucti]
MRSERTSIGLAAIALSADLLQMVNSSSYANLTEGEFESKWLAG